MMQNVAESMDGVPQEIQIRAVARFYQAEKRCGLGIAKHLGLDEKVIAALVK
ncbi:MAG: hypothetical protein LBE12_06545 [Planctomycetaceae bacterium]|nr:hypothetical protein [Planctomycetaceae bacterium]